MKKTCGIYKITSPSGRIYIGQSVDCYGRNLSYKYARCNKQIKLYNSIKKYGWKNHEFEIIHKCNPEELNELEKYYIAKFNSFNSENGMNLRGGGDSKWDTSNETRKKLSLSNTGKTHSEETRKKMSLSQMGRTCTEETRKKLSSAWIGRIVSEETKKKISLSNTGKKHTEQTIKKRSLSLTGRKHSKETKEKLKIKSTGRKHSEETKQKMRGRKVSKETKEKLRIVNLGKKLSEETKKKISFKNSGENHPFYGKKLSDSHVINLSISHKNYSKEIKEKMSIRMKKHPLKYWLGKKRSEETKEKIRIKKSKLILNLNTGIYYFGVPEAAMFCDIHKDKLRRILNNKNKHSAEFIYA